MSFGLSNEITDSRPRLKVNFTRPREYFTSRQGDIKLSSREALESSTELRPFKDPTYDLHKLEHDIAIQAVADTTIRVVQTPWFRKVDSAIQAQPTVVDVRRDFGSSDLKEDVREKIPNIIQSLNSACPRIFRNLIQNDLVPIFQDDYLTLQDDESFIGHREKSVLKEYQSFVHHRFTKGKAISSIDWQPKSTKNVVISVVEPLSFAERLLYNRKVQSSFVIIWSFNDPILPQFLLEAPAEVNIVKFNPTQPNLLAGGCKNGQVVLWDITKATEQIKVKTRKGRAHVVGDEASQKAQQGQTKRQAEEDTEAGGERGEDDSHIIRIKWIQISKIETAHKRVVTDLCWLPETLESNFEGKLHPSPDEMQHQFATISSDGTMFIWDTRKDNIRKDKLRKALKGATEKGSEAPWIPVYKVQLSKIDGTGDIAALRMVMESGKIDPYRLCCTTEEGDFVMANWEATEEKKEVAVNIEYGQMDKEQTCIKAMYTGHFGPAWSIQRHPFGTKGGLLANIFLTVGDWSFKIWMTGVPSPIVASPCGQHYMTCARWSPNRPSIVFIGTSDGYLQIWDLLDRSHEPTIQQTVSQVPITSIEFKDKSDNSSRNRNQNWLAVGDEVGVLHIYELPKILLRAHLNEKVKMEEYFERELQRVNFFSQRWKVRQKELEELNSRMQAEKLEQQINAAAGVNEQQVDDSKKEEDLFGEAQFQINAHNLEQEMEEMAT